MNASSGSPAGPGIIGWILRLVLVGVSVYFIYWAYQKLYAANVDSSVLLKDIYIGNPAAPYKFAKANLPPLFEGGEYSISFWIYVNGWANSNRYMFNKNVISIGNLDDAGKITLGVYLDSKDNVLHVNTGSIGNGSISGATYKAKFNNAMSNPSTASGSPDTGDCSVTPFALQRWVQITVALSGKTADVYMDGKLARSCILNDIFAVDSNYEFRICDNNGFTGFISGVKANSYALNPEEVYRIYMAGPLGAVGWSEYVKSFFDPKSIGTLDYPKMNL
jgi:hypothetical protein